jgi:hypothetical protein
VVPRAFAVPVCVVRHYGDNPCLLAPESPDYCIYPALVEKLGEEEARAKGRH